MQTAIDYLNEALDIGRKEFIALASDNLDEAESLSEKRNWLISQAWSAKQGADGDTYKSKLLQIQNMQHRLTVEATAKKQEVMKVLMRSRKENRRLTGYKKAMVGYGT